MFHRGFPEILQPSDFPSGELNLQRAIEVCAKRSRLHVVIGEPVESLFLTTVKTTAQPPLPSSTINGGIGDLAWICLRISNFCRLWSNKNVQTHLLQYDLLNN